MAAILTFSTEVLNVHVIGFVVVCAHRPFWMEARILKSRETLRDLACALLSFTRGINVIEVYSTLVYGRGTVIGRAGTVAYIYSLY